MKCFLSTCACLLAVLAAPAQNDGRMARAGVYAEGDRTVVADPGTMLVVDLTVRCERVLSGPYARYAQKYLGVLAPLTDKTVWTLTGGLVAVYADAEAPYIAGKVSVPERTVVSHVRPEGEFARLQPDKLSMEVLPLEDAAREAARTLFALRRHRMELITGEAGEHVFGAGLSAALEEIGRLEQSYSELFLGLRTVETRTVRLFVEPGPEDEQYIVCRFAPESGVLPATDLSGSPVVLRIVPSGRTECPWESERNGALFRIADPAECTLSYGGEVLDRRVLPVFEMGRTVRIVLPKSGR